ncbi:MAG TPA: aminotransferase class V-fold PLP-dependent enzyme [Acidobacteriota bacterium]
MYVPAWPVLSPSCFFEASRDSLPYPLNSPHQTYSYVARNLIYHLFRALHFREGESVLVPNYHHGNEVRAIRSSGARIHFYRINRDLEPDLEELNRLCKSTPGLRALFVIHYLGWPQPIREIRAICRECGIILIEDCAISLFSKTQGEPLGSFGDYAIFCLYKTLPLPNGGLLVQSSDVLEDLARLNMKSASVASVAGRTSDLALAWIRSRSDFFGGALCALKRLAGQTLSGAGVKRVPVGDTGFDLANVNVAISSVCHSLLKRFDYERVWLKRRENFLLLEEKLQGRATLLRKELGEDVCPLFFPILVPDKPSAAQALWQRGIEAVQFWNHGDPEAKGKNSSDAQFLRDHVLELPIHQDVTPRQVGYMADQVLRLKLHF